jgi:glycerol-1-phosphate dehydrogenase [NAD(P)+]
VREELDRSEALVVGDPRTLAACGERLAEELRAAGCRVVTLDLAEPPGALHADDEAVRRARDALAATGAVPVAVGSGTVNDVVKAAAHEQRRPYLAVPTAASMNGYTSSIAAITHDGLKRTIPARPPVAVLADPAVLAAAPRRMAISGLADLLSKPVSHADWRLGHLLWGDPYCPVPGEIAAHAVERAARVAPELADGDPSAMEALFEGLLVSGISMAVAGSSSPASGGEHLISHTLDLTAPYAPGGPRRPALHGEQVGVATAATTRLYRSLLDRSEAEVDWNRAASRAPGHKNVPELVAQAAHLPAALRQRLVEEGSRKLGRLGPPRDRVERIRRQWDRIRRELAGDLVVAETYGEVLPPIGAPVRPASIGVSLGEFRIAYRLARWMRDRYTVLDLAGDLDLLDEAEVESQVLLP